MSDINTISPVLRAQSEALYEEVKRLHGAHNIIFVGIGDKKFVVAVSNKNTSRAKNMIKVWRNQPVQYIHMGKVIPCAGL